MRGLAGLTDSASAVSTSVLTDLGSAGGSRPRTTESSPAARRSSPISTAAERRSRSYVTRWIRPRRPRSWTPPPGYERGISASMESWSRYPRGGTTASVSASTAWRTSWPRLGSRRSRALLRAAPGYRYVTRIPHRQGILPGLAEHDGHGRGTADAGCRRRDASATEGIYRAHRPSLPWPVPHRRYRRTSDHVAGRCVFGDSRGRRVERGRVEFRHHGDVGAGRRSLRCQGGADRNASRRSRGDHRRDSAGPWRSALYIRVRAAVAEADVDQRRRPYGCGTERGLWAVGSVLPAGARGLRGTVDLDVFRLDPAVPCRRRPARSADFRFGLHLVHIHRRPRCRPDGDADHLLGDAGGVLPGTDRRARRRVRAGRDALGYDPHRGPPVRTRRDHRWDDAGAWTRTWRDDRRLHDSLADLQSSAAHPGERRQHDLGVDRPTPRRGHGLRHVRVDGGRLHALPRHSCRQLLRLRDDGAQPVRCGERGLRHDGHPRQASEPGSATR